MKNNLKSSIIITAIAGTLFITSTTSTIRIIKNRKNTDYKITTLYNTITQKEDLYVVVVPDKNTGYKILDNKFYSSEEKARKALESYIYFDGIRNAEIMNFVYAGSTVLGAYAIIEQLKEKKGKAKVRTR